MKHFEYHQPTKIVFGSGRISEAGEKVTNEISEAKESSQKIINEEISNFNPIESIQNIFRGS